MLFHLFFMIYNKWRIKCRSQNPDGKRTVKIPYFRRSAEHRKTSESFYFARRRRDPEGEPEGATQGPHHFQARAHPWPRLGRVWAPWPTSGTPSRVLHPLETVRHGEPSKKYSAASSGRKTPEREKLSGREKSAGEIPPRREEIVAIVTVIELDFIGAIIVIIIITITIISTAPLRSAVTSRVESCLFHRGNFPGVVYSL